MKKISIKKKKELHRNLRTAMMTILSIIVLISAYTAYAAYQQPTTTEKTVTTYTYRQDSNFDYTVSLKNNTVYDNIRILKPGQDIIFRKLTESINASFTYRFTCSQNAQIQGYYTVLAQLNTDLWSKEYTLTPKTSFSSNGKKVDFTTTFPIDYTHFEGIVSQIDAETGVSAGDPTLNIKCSVVLSAEIPDDSIYESFSPSLSVPLGGNIIRINGDLSPSESGSLKGSETIFLQDVIEQQNQWSLTSIIFFILLVVFFVFTESGFIPISKTEKMVKKIQKKYGEWIAEVEKPPTVKGAKTIPMKSLEDLIKISEELGKPVIHYKSPEESEAAHTFSVLDEGMHYEYTFTHGEKITKTTRCPQCKTKVTYEAYPGESVHVTCLSCGNKGIIKPKKTNIPKTLKKLVGR